MLKSFFRTVILFFALTLLIVKASFSSPLPQETPSPEAAKTESSEATKTNVDVPDCYVQSADGKIVELGRPCEKAPAIFSAPSPTNNPYDTEAIEKFDDELYGEGN